jgi:hypothetical protein
VVCGVLLGVLALGMLAPAALAQENPNRPTHTQPSPGVPFTRPAEDKPWSYNWAARPTIVIVLLFLVALLLGFVVRWIGLGRRAS